MQRRNAKRKENTVLTSMDKLIARKKKNVAAVEHSQLQQPTAQKNNI